jgi:hypothetical protein
MFGNYERVTGAELAYWDGENDVAEPDNVINAKVEEMYEDNGTIVIRFEDRDDNSDFYDLTIPVKAKDSWNEFVDSLPKWE